MSDEHPTSIVPPPLDGSAERLARDPRYRLLDVCRGVACLMIVLNHAGYVVFYDNESVSGLDGWLRYAVVGVLWRMNLGVPVFFVISGYCIAASADALRGRDERGGALRFLGRRVWRIYPPYWAALFVFVAVTGGLDAIGQRRLHLGGDGHALMLDSPSNYAATQWIGNITLTEGYRTLFVRRPEMSIFTRVAWSLCYEEQFYFICFLALFAGRRLFRALWFVTVAVVALRLAADDTGQTYRFGNSFPLLWHEFAVGLAVYWRLVKAESSGAKRSIELGLVGLILLWRNGYFGGTPTEGSTPTAAGFGLALIALRRWDDRIARLGWLAPLRWSGRRSYSIYLIHTVVCTVAGLWLYDRGLAGFWARVLVTVPIISALAVGASWLFYLGVERHFLNPPILGRDRRAAPEPAGPPRA